MIADCALTRFQRDSLIVTKHSWSSSLQWRMCTHMSLVSMVWKSHLSSKRPWSKSCIKPLSVQSSSGHTPNTALEVREAACYSLNALLNLLSPVARAVLQPLSDMAEKTTEFREAFLCLERRFTATNTIHIAFVSSHILGVVEDTSQYLRFTHSRIT